MQLVIDPNQFDVLLLENVYGDIVLDLAAGWSEGVWMWSAGRISARRGGVRAVHGSAPDIAGQKRRPSAYALLQ